MIAVSVSPPAGQFQEFVRVDLRASDNGSFPTVTGPFEILFTTDGSVPSDSNPATKIRRSPILRLPLDRPTTLKFFARVVASPSTATAIQIGFFDIIALVPVGSIKTAPVGVTNYTLEIDENGDITRTGDGRYGVVFGVDKTGQDIREIILVENVDTGQPIGNRTSPSFGSALNRLLGQDFPIGVAINDIRSTIFDALSTLIDLQRAQRVPSDEQIRRILDVSVSAVDPTTFKYRFAVETVSGQKPVLTGVLSR
jgi:hypothetical protein